MSTVTESRFWRFRAYNRNSLVQRPVNINKVFGVAYRSTVSECPASLLCTQIFTTSMT